MNEDYLKKKIKAVRIQNIFYALLFFLGIIILQYMAYIFCVMFSQAFYIVAGKTTDLVSDLKGNKLYYQNFMMMVNIVYVILAFIWGLFLYKRSTWRVKPFPFKKVFSIKNVAAYLIMGASLCVLISMLLIGLQTAFPGAFKNYAKIMGSLQVDQSFLTAIYVLLLGPIAEEMIFRGVIFDRFRMGLPYWLANALQALLFGIYHANLIQGIYAFVIGMLLGWVALQTQSVFPGMIVHICLNCTSALLGNVKLPKGMSPTVFFVLIETVSAALLALSIIMMKGRKNTNEMV